MSKQPRPSMAAEIERRARMFFLHVTESAAFERVGLVIARSGRPFPEDDEIMRGCVDAARRDAARGIRTV